MPVRFRFICHSLPAVIGAQLTRQAPLGEPDVRAQHCRSGRRPIAAYSPSLPSSASSCSCAGQRHGLEGGRLDQGGAHAQGLAPLSEVVLEDGPAVGLGVFLAHHMRPVQRELVEHRADDVLGLAAAAQLQVSQAVVGLAVSRRREAVSSEQPDRPSWWAVLLNGFSSGAARALLDWLLRIR